MNKYFIIIIHCIYEWTILSIPNIYGHVRQMRCKGNMMTSSNGNISALPALCAGNSPVTGEFPTQRPVTRSFDVFFDLRLNKQLIKQWWGWWFETPLRPLWRHCNKWFHFQVWIQHSSSRIRLDDSSTSPNRSYDLLSHTQIKLQVRHLGYIFPEFAISNNPLQALTGFEKQPTEKPNFIDLTGWSNRLFRYPMIISRCSPSLSHHIRYVNFMHSVTWCCLLHVNTQHDSYNNCSSNM